MLKVITPFAQLKPSVRLLVAVVELALLGLVWYFFAPSAIPKPDKVLTALGYLITDKGLIYETWVSLSANMIALAIAATISLTLCYLRPLPPLRPAVDGLSLLRYLGVAGLTFTFMVLIKDAYTRKIAILVFAMIPWLMISLSEVVRTIPSEQFDHARTLKLGHFGVIWQVIVRGRMSDAIEVVRQNVAMSWMMVATVEGLMRSGGGIGTLLLEANKFFKLDQIFAILIVILILGVLQDNLLATLRRVFCPYAVLNRRSL